ncbi:MAG: hypothetical protein ACYTG6_12210, partial [Planctomycetota bacterium]
MKHLVLFLPLLLLAPLAVAEDEDSYSQRAAGWALQAWANNDRAYLDRLADVSGYDMWMVTCRLCAMGRPAVATYLAEASDRVGLETLPAQVRAWVASPPSGDLLRQWTAVEAAYEHEDWEATLGLTDDFDTGPDLFLQAYLALVRGRSMHELDRKDEAVAALSDASRIATDLGWLYGLTQALWRLGHSQRDTRDYEGALESWSHCAAVYDRQEQRVAAALCRGNLGALSVELGDGRMGVRELEAALDVLREEDRPADVGLMLANLAVAKEHLGLYAAALSHLDE